MKNKQPVSKYFIISLLSTALLLPIPLATSAEGLKSFPLTKIGMPKLPEFTGQSLRGVSSVKLANVGSPEAMIIPRLSLPDNESNIVLKSSISNIISEVDLTIGKAQIINLKIPVERITISDPTIAKAVVINPMQIQLVGKQIGVANIILWPNKDASKQVMIDINVHKDVSMLAKQLQLIDPGINIQPLAADNSVILTGEVASSESSQLAVEVAKAFFTHNPDNASSNSSHDGGGVSSQAPGSGISDTSPNVINLIKVAGKPSTKMGMVKAKLKELDPAIELEVVPGEKGTEKAILTGRVKSANIVSQAISIASIFYGQAGMKVVTGPGGNLIRETGSADFHLSGAFSDNKDINMLQGSVVTDSTGNVISLLKVAQKPQIKCRIKFFDMTKSDFSQLGATLNGVQGGMAFGSFSGSQGASRIISSLQPQNSTSRWNTLSNGGNVLSNSLTQVFRDGVTQVFSFNQDLTMALSAFIEKHNIKALAEPSITMLSGEKASFLAGGEVPIPITGNNGQISVMFKEFGIRLNLIPTVTESGKINMQVAPEVSSIDPSNGIITNGISIPGFRTRRMQTTLELENGQSFVLAGLYNSQDVSSMSKFPGIGSIPILGQFFKGRNSTHNDNEIVVIIEPEITMISN